MNSEYSMIITTCANKEAAKAIAKLLVEQHLAACVQMLSVESVYIWKDKLCDDNETALFVKAKSEMFDKITAAIKGRHTYTVPEIIQIPITNGLPEYLKWIDDCSAGSLKR